MSLFTKVKHCENKGCDTPLTGRQRRFCSDECCIQWHNQHKRSLAFGTGYMRQDTYETLLKRQRNQCAMCGIPLKRGYIDHDHKTGAMRGILCNKCNVGLHYVENREFVRMAKHYLRKW